MYSLQAGPCSLQPRHFTGLGSEGVKCIYSTTDDSVFVVALMWHLSSANSLTNPRTKSLTLLYANTPDRRDGSVQFKMVSACWEKPICTPPCLSEVFPVEIGLTKVLTLAVSHMSASPRYDPCMVGSVLKPVVNLLSLQAHKHTYARMCTHTHTHPYTLIHTYTHTNTHSHTHKHTHKNQ